MPSFRAIVQITGVRPGHQPPEVLDVAAAAVCEPAASVEARSIDIVRGVPVIIVRYAVPPTGDDSERDAALATAFAVRDAAATVATVAATTVTRRSGNRWIPA